ncbi:MAG: 16S rRNA (cytosine(1402)-N(4))-methyltransferase RsmH [Desulfobulbaceae bacterium]|nr:16S rRNA (cytosine(1402)-N(4))-methyltransferase RsmH [Desulfobulbaceae bacterium]
MGIITPIHQSVLLEEAVSYLAPVDGGIYVDGCLGLGGHTARILEVSQPGGRVIGFEWDADALAMARQRLKQFGNRVTFVRKNYSSLKEAMAELGIQGIDGLLLDLGLSSFQLDLSGRGFSFKGSEPLDMRMDDRTTETAADIINTVTQEELADIFYLFGGERQARPIAASIAAERKNKKILTTDQLVSIVSRAIPKRFHPKKIHVATKVFQGLRIAVNRELDNLVTVLEDSATLLNPGAGISVISFHSLEDRLVKRFFKQNPALDVLTSKPVEAGEEERRRNPRARSAKLRACRKSATVA